MPNFTLHLLLLANSPLATIAPLADPLNHRILATNGATMSRPSLFDLENHSDFIQRHIAPTAQQQSEMAQTLGYDSMDALIDDTVPAAIRSEQPLQISGAKTEQEVVARLREFASLNTVNRSFIGTGYHDTITPAVIQRNVLENPGWYTAYTPYQPEISQGRLEALLTFQQMILDLTGMDLANASMLDESTAAAEAMTLLQRVNKKNRSATFIIADDCHPQTIAVVRTRAEALDIEVVVGNPAELLTTTDAFGLLLQYPGTYGHLNDISPLVEKAHASNTLVAVAADIMSLLLVKSPGAMGADVVVGTTQRFGVPLATRSLSSLRLLSGCGYSDFPSPSDSSIWLIALDFYTAAPMPKR